ncbi:MAG: hypothetical protein EXS51_01645 [Candidatus Taylorbacteria bacterium]|nr:hypothetical protein [Candidatus Taylorbacteria bacterium]
MDILDIYDKKVSEILLQSDSEVIRHDQYLNEPNKIYLFILSILFSTFSLLVVHIFFDLSISGTTFPMSWEFLGILVLISFFPIASLLLRVKRKILAVSFSATLFLLVIPAILIIMRYGHTLTFYFLAILTGYVSVSLAKFLGEGGKKLLFLFPF